MDLVAPNVQHGEREDATHVPEELDHGLHNAENYVQDEQVDVDALPTVADDDNTNGALTRMRLTDKAFADLVCNLNAKQREAFDMVVQYTSSLHKFHLGQEAQPKPIRKELVCNLNAKQRKAFDMEVQYTSMLHKFHLGQEASQPKPIHMFITGGAGAGKVLRDSCHQRTYRKVSARE